MGLSYSRAHHKVTKVAPVQTKEEVPTSPCTAAVCGFHSTLEERRLCSFAAMEERNPVFQRQLPPLRETLYGRCSTVPRPISFDIMMETGETSIIKQHPPRRLQKLEPADLPQVITSEKLFSQQEGAAARKAKVGLEKRVQTAKYTSGRRQHLHKLQMLEMNRKREEVNQEELKRSLHREEKINKQKTRELKAKKVLENLQRNNCSEGEDLLLWPLLSTNFGIGPWVPLMRFHSKSLINPLQLGVQPRIIKKMVFLFLGNTWDGEFLERHEMAESYPSQSSKVEMWFVKHQEPQDLFWDSSSTDSDDWKREERKLGRRPALVRTKTERIPLFDEFFDKEF
uniref:Coiled-coil domain containing 198 n=1 Tax=Chrysemys picta bellii TaxID=8478 RepID=A0A8C3INT4_CHRPI